ncbi:MAG: hypothetical protein GY789_29985 [Hyphomicrobiales bacterium]|nr:hypothetical protein [Hyphomicrobiales bacterium]
MLTIETQEQIEEFERQRALVGTYIDHSYSRDRLDWVLGAREGFDAHVGNAFHLLIPHTSNGYSVNHSDEHQYGVALAREVIRHLEIKHAELPCIVFRAAGDDYYFLKLGHRDKENLLEVIGRIGDLAVECAQDGPKDPNEFRDWVNMQTANFLRREKMLSALKRSLPALNGLLGGAVNVKELV